MTTWLPVGCGEGIVLVKHFFIFIFQLEIYRKRTPVKRYGFPVPLFSNLREGKIIEEVEEEAALLALQQLGLVQRS